MRWESRSESARWSSCWSRQPVYYEHGGGGFEEGKKMARTWADYINYEMEHGAFDFHRFASSCAVW